MKQLARIAGDLYLIIIPGGFFAKLPSLCRPMARRRSTSGSPIPGGWAARTNVVEVLHAE